jgi:hypothetical protein
MILHDAGKGSEVLRHALQHGCSAGIPNRDVGESGISARSCAKAKVRGLRGMPPLTTVRIDVQQDVEGAAVL